MWCRGGVVVVVVIEVVVVVVIEVVVVVVVIEVVVVVYVARNPKDMVVSYHHHSRIINVHGFDGTLDDFVQYFVDDDLVYGTYAGHLKEAWEQRNHPNMHIIFFEDMKKDAVAELKRLNTFLGTKLTEKQLENVAQHTSFKAMKQREADLMGEGDGNDPFMHPERTAKDGGFFRKGETGDWKNKLTPALAAKGRLTQKP
ncbi:Sulfotransferase 1A1 [Chionoecetes opilio]|uniref:Sulfotransferase 1A1 n=1 Tax=Chionoecetes opilio TaxID=41210 RepID=A0A8J4YAM9_CHIOP|nr:Sulfotransferase 1A1 [Chionoecetes opilio]